MRPEVAETVAAEPESGVSRRSRITLEMDLRRSTLHTRRQVEDEGLGGKFWAGLFGIVIAAGIGAFILLLLFSRAVYAWGFFGAFLALAVVLIIIAWFYDRRHTRSYDD